MTTKTTPRRTGTASTRRRATKVSIRQNGGPRDGPPYPPAFGAPRETRGTPLCRGPPSLSIQPGLPERQVVLDGMDGESLHARASDDDLLRRVDRDPHHFLGEDVLHLAVELLPLGLVEAATSLLDHRVHARIRVARRV